MAIFVFFSICGKWSVSLSDLDLNSTNACKLHGTIIRYWTLGMTPIYDSLPQKKSFDTIARPLLQGWTKWRSFKKRLPWSLGARKWLSWCKGLRSDYNLCQFLILLRVFYSLNLFLIRQNRLKTYQNWPESSKRPIILCSRDVFVTFLNRPDRNWINNDP